MKNSKLIQVLSTLSKVEIREFKKYLQSPLHNQREDVQQLLSLLLAKQTTTPFPNKQYLYQALFPDQSFEVIKLDLLVSYLFRLLQNYLAWKNWQADTHTVQFHAGQSFAKRGLKTIASSTFDKLTKDLEKKPNRATDYFFKLQQIQWAEHQLADTNSPQDTIEKWAMTTTLDHWYYIEKLKHYCLLLSYQQVYPFPYQLPAITAILNNIQVSKKLGIPTIAVYYHCAEMLKNPENKDNFLVFKDLLFQHQNLLSNSEFRGLLLMSINFCVRQINNGQRNYLSQLLEFYQVGLTTDTLLENGSLSRITYHNIIGTGINSDNLSWTKQFIEQYKNLLEKKYRESTYSFSLARLAYHQKSYEEVLQLLQKSNYRDLLLNLAAKTLLLKVYVEQDEDALLFAHVEAMQRYIRRKHVIGYHKKNYLNIIKYTKKMRSLNFFDKTEVAAFTKKIQQVEVLTEKSWFLDQLANL